MLTLSIRENKLIIIFVIASLIFTACTGNKSMELSQEDFVSVIDQKLSGFFTKTIGPIKYTLQYKPVEYVMLRELNESCENPKDWENLKKEYEKYEYYTFEIAIDEFNEEILKYNLKSEQEYSERLNYYAFKFQNDLKLVQGKDTLFCTAYHFERNYGLASNVRFMLAFRKSEATKERTFVCEEKYLGNSTVKINIDPNLLSDIPTLKLN